MALVLVALLAACSGGGSTPESVGTVSGLSGSGLVLQVNGGGTVAVAAGSTSFRFQAVAEGGDTISVVSQPTTPLQICTAVGPLAVQCDTVADLLFAASANLHFVQALAVHPSSGRLVELPTARHTLDDSLRPGAMTAAAGGRILYVLVEPSSGATSTVALLSINAATGALTPVGSSAVVAGQRPVGLTLHPNGRFAYVSAQDGLYGFTIDGSSGALTAMLGSPFAIPADAGALAIEPGGRFAYVNDSIARAVAAYALDATTGVPTPLTGSPFAAGIQPGPVAIHPGGRFVYSANTALGPRSLATFAIRQDNGALDVLAGSPFSVAMADTSLTGQLAFVTVDATGGFLWAWGWQALATLRLDATTGVPSATTGGSGLGAIGTLAGNADGRFVFDARPCCIYGPGIAAGVVDAGTGALGAAIGSPFTQLAAPLSLAVTRLR